MNNHLKNQHKAIISRNFMTAETAYNPPTTTTNHAELKGSKLDHRLLEQYIHPEFQRLTSQRLKILLKHNQNVPENN
ncbi:hypothetical protein JTE90_026933 [Oedothorax gibbosus]|uniref:Uncharacterized protein n=1 Tax=Oedothorax gibbosus TaxID=931172 RepID=A0AAV6TW30_9ARAC|nr:hypothetical protein JTE90_026933 [Oedothorax gibbosus]